MESNWTQIDNSFTIKFEEPEIKPEIKTEIKEEPLEEIVDESAKENKEPQRSQNPVRGENTEENFSREEIQKIVEIVGVEKLKILGPM